MIKEPTVVNDYSGCKSKKILKQSITLIKKPDDFKFFQMTNNYECLVTCYDEFYLFDLNASLLLTVSVDLECNRKNQYNQKELFHNQLLLSLSGISLILGKKCTNLNSVFY
jgi:hypothetical protein